MLPDQEHLENIEEVFENFQSYFFKEIISKTGGPPGAFMTKKYCFFLKKYGYPEILSTLL